MFEIGLFYSMCFICDSYLLKYFLVLINISRIAIKQNCAQSNFHYLLTLFVKKKDFKFGLNRKK